MLEFVAPIVAMMEVCSALVIVNESRCKLTRRKCLAFKPPTVGLGGISSAAHSASAAYMRRQLETHC